MTQTTSLSTARRIAGVSGLLELLDAGRLVTDGEPVDRLTHGLQCAAILERVAPDDLGLQVAGLVHDIGTVLAPERPLDHAAAGADALRPVLGTRVADLVAGHDEAKRYLVTIDASYRECLSERGRATLRLQGGLMDPEERAAFLARRDADDLVTLRRADDAARRPARPVPGIDHWTLALYAIAATAPR